MNTVLRQKNNFPENSLTENLGSVPADTLPYYVKMTKIFNYTFALPLFPSVRLCAR